MSSEYIDIVLAGDIGVFRGGSGFPVRFQGQKSGQLPFFKVSDMNRPGNELFMDQANNYVSEELRASMGAARIPAGAIVFAKVGAAVYLERKRILAHDSCIDNNMAAFIVDNSRFDVRFLHYLLSAFKLSSLVAATALPSLNGTQLRSIPLLMPSTVAEQREIARTLSSVDMLISSIERLIEKKQAIKKGMMRQLLAGQTRLPGFHGEWEVKTLSELADIRSGGTPSTTEPKFWDGEVPWCTPTDITALSGHKYLRKTSRTITEQGLKSSSAEMIPAQSIVMTSRATIGDCAINQVPVSTNQGFKNFVPFQSVDVDFLYYLLTTQKQGFISLCGGSTFLEIGKGQLVAFEVRLPCAKAEQTAIATVLTDMDTELALLEARLAKTRALKQGMMQELLTGRTRLVAAEDAS